MNAIKTLVLLTQICAAKAQRQEIDTWQLLVLYVLAAIGIVAVWWKMCQLSWQLGEWMFPEQAAEPTPPQGAEVQLRLQGSQVQLNSQVHRDSQWRGIGNPNWTFVNCRASGSPAAGRSRIDSSSCRKGVRGKMGAKGSSRKNDPGRAHQMAQARRTIDPW